MVAGVAPEFVVDVSARGTWYTLRGRQSSLDELTAALHAAATYSGSAAPIAVIGAVAAAFALMVDAWLFCLTAVAAIALTAYIARANRMRRRVAVLYRTDERSRAAFASISDGIGWLASCAAVLRSTHYDRPRAAVARDDVDNLVTNVSVPSIAAAGETLSFLPDVLLLRDRAHTFRVVPYSEIVVAIDTERVTEDGAAPHDARQVGVTWRYVNKNGTPDKRRANNAQLPIVEYTRIALTARNWSCVLLASNAEAARRFANALQPVAAPAVKPPSEPAPEVNVVIPPVGPTELERALQASIERKLRLEELARQTVAVAAQRAAVSPTATPPPSTPAPVTARPAKQRAEWLSRGSSATVHGFATGDLVYVGNTLPALRRGGSEPALIDPALAVDPATANTAGEGVPYWPSYAGISPASRRAFLQWLAGGRSDPNAYIGYVFIFLYGLERRVYDIVRQRVTAPDELLVIAAEVTRLLGIYGHASRSFAGHGAAFLDFIAAVDVRARDLCRDLTPMGFGPPQHLRAALGELSLAGQPIPAADALEWVRSSASLNTPAARCRAEFERLFAIRYARQFGEGMKIPPNKSVVTLRYDPASSNLEPLSLRCEVPDVTQLARPLAQLIGLATECTEALDAYSRFLGKNPDGRDSLAAFAVLPVELVDGHTSSDAASLESLITARIEGGATARFGGGELLSLVRLSKPGKLAKNEAMLLAQALEKLGYGLEPDVRVGGPVFGAEEPVIVFRRLPDCPSTASDEYATATLCMRLGAIVSAADDEVSQSERALLQQHIAETLHLSAGERQRLAAHLEWVLAANAGTTGLKRVLAALTTEKRQHIGQLLITVAASDGRVDPREMKMLEKLYDLIGLSASDLYKDVHAAVSGTDDPVTIALPGTAPKGFSIPPRPGTPTSAGGIDMQRVRLKIAETRQVSTLLASIFVEEEEAPRPAPAIMDANTIGTLDAAHSELLRRLAQRDSWPRDEVERIAAELSLLTDGALETINDYAYAAAADAFWEDDDPLAINTTVARELIA